MKLLADENFRGAIVRGLLRRRPSRDLVRVPDVGLSEADDPTVRAWAAAEGCLVRTHDAATLIGSAYQRLAAEEVMPGIIEVRQELPIGVVIEDVLLLIGASTAGAWDGQVRYLPLREHHADHKMAWASSGRDQKRLTPSPACTRFRVPNGRYSGLGVEADGRWSAYKTAYNGPGKQCQRQSTCVRLILLFAALQREIRQ